jgi:tetrahydromethanopterin S-methyltransferase subunit G
MKDWNALSLDEKITYIKDQNHKLFKFIEAEFGKTYRRLDQIDKRLDQIDRRLDQIDRRLDQIDRRLDQIDKRLDSIDEKLERVCNPV